MIYCVYGIEDPIGGESKWFAEYWDREGGWQAAASGGCPLEALALLFEFLVATMDWPVERKRCAELKRRSHLL